MTYTDSSNKTQKYTDIEKNEFYVSELKPKEGSSYFINNFISSTKGYELLWMNLSCCCSRTSFGTACSTVTTCDSVKLESWWTTKKFTPLNNTFTNTNAEQATGTGTPGVKCGTIVKEGKTTRCNGQLSYKTHSRIQLRDQRTDEVVPAGPLTSIGSAPYMLALGWNEFFDN